MRPEEKKDAAEQEYIGNIWGWKFSFMGLILILTFSSILFYRHYVLGVPLQVEEQRHSLERDTIQQSENLKEIKR